MSRTEEVWEEAVEAGVIPVSTDGLSHDDLYRAVAFAVEASSTPARTPVPYSSTDMAAYASLRMAECVSGQDVKDKLLRKMEAAMAPGVRWAVEVRINEASDHR